MESFVEKYLTETTELFVSSYNDRIKSFIKKFMKAQELGYLNDTSCFKFKECDVENIVFLFERMHFDFEEDEEFVDGHPDDYTGDFGSIQNTHQVKPEVKNFKPEVVFK